MSTQLKLSVPEYDQMVENGAFNQLNRRIELRRIILLQPHDLHNKRPI